MTVCRLPRVQAHGGRGADVEDAVAESGGEVPMKRVSIILSVAALLAVLGPGPQLHAGASGGSAYVPTDAERARLTMADMRTLAITLAAYHQDNGKYPAGATLDAMISSVEPIYVRHAPRHDAWGTPFRYVPDEDLSGFTLVSAGADGVFDEKTWSQEKTSENFADDAVVRNTDFIRKWAYR
jgi:hypothetical protein